MSHPPLDIRDYFKAQKIEIDIPAHPIWEIVNNELRKKYAKKQPLTFQKIDACFTNLMTQQLDTASAPYVSAMLRLYTQKQKEIRLVESPVLYDRNVQQALNDYVVMAVTVPELEETADWIVDCLSNFDGVLPPVKKVLLK